MVFMVSFMKIALLSTLALILLPGPPRAGKNWAWIRAGFWYFSLLATSLVSLK